jgi:hypothetical protein
VHATIKYFRTERLLFPSRLETGPHKGELTWVPLSLRRASHALHNPFYAGAYAYGRRRCRRQPDGRTRCERVPPAEWHALIRDAHPAYISWQEYERIEQRLQLAAKRLGFERGGVPREGPALLQGRAVCGLCGRRMEVHYNVRRGGRLITNYVCWGRGRYFGDPTCQNILGTEIDAAVGQMVLDAVTPMALELTLAVQQEMQSRLDEADRVRHRQVERAQYEADCARRRYMQVDPANRLVADSLEAEWNSRLRALAEAQADYERQRTADRVVVGDAERQRILALTTDFPAVWHAPQTPQRERKRMLALLIEDVTLIKRQQITAAVRFRGGATTTLTLPRPRTAQELRATSDPVRQEIDALLNEHTDARVAAILNERGRRTGAGDAFDGVSVQWVRFSAKLPSLKERLLAAGMLTSKQMAARLRIGRSTLGDWRRAGKIKARICTDRGEWLYGLPDRSPREASAPPAPPDAPVPLDTAETNETAETADNSPARGAV